PKHKNWKGLDLEPAFFAANKDFHVGIAKASGSIRLTDIVSFLHDEAERVLRYAARQHGLVDTSLFEDWAHGHDEILEALIAGDGKTAERLARTGLEKSERIVIDVLREKAEQLPI
ncbi:MAG: FCD domain-containing protein, partial [Pseudomonadota bacterium]